MKRQPPLQQQGKINPMPICDPCSRGSHHHDRLPDTGEDAGCPYRVDDYDRPCTCLVRLDADTTTLLCPTCHGAGRIPDDTHQPAGLTP